MSEILQATIECSSHYLSTKYEPLLELQAFCQMYKLTPRESEIVCVLSQGVTRIKDIADQLRLSPNTVNNHVNSMFVKTKARSKSQLLSMLLGHFSDALKWARFFRRVPKVVLVIPQMDFSVKLHSVLMDFGFRVEILSSVDECCRLMRETTVNFVVAELSSGSVNPLELLEVAASTRSTQVLFLGGNGSIRNRCEAMDLGAIDLIHVSFVSDFTQSFQEIAETLLAHYMENESDRARFYDAVKPVKFSCRGELALHPNNVGQGGVFLSAQELRELFGDQVDAGDIVELKLIRQSGETPAWAKGQVVWIRREGDSDGPPGAGVRLLHFNKSAQESESELRNDWMNFIQQNRIMHYIPKGWVPAEANAV